MRLLVAALTPLAMLIVVSCTSAEPQTTLPRNSPACTDITKVEVPVIVFGEESLRNGTYSRSSTTIDSRGQIVTGQLQVNTVGTDSQGRRYVSPPTVSSKSRPQVAQISPYTVKALLHLASTEGFWDMIDNDEAGRPSSSTQYIFIRLSCANHRVSVSRGNEPSEFREIYKLLKDLERIQPKKLLL